jgi:hypothetical protein
MAMAAGPKVRRLKLPLRSTPPRVPWNTRSSRPFPAKDAVICSARNRGVGPFVPRDDLMTAQIGVDPALKPLPASAADAVVGKRAAMDLAAGGLVTQEDITSAVVPSKGMSLVGVSLPPALMPAAQLQSGDQVRIVATPGAQGDLATGTSPTSIGATVVGVRGAGDNGQIVVDVSVPYDQAAELAARAATGKIALVLDSRER